MLGAAQRAWLKEGLIGSAARWNVLAQQVMMGMVGVPSGDDPTPRYSMDQWPGYAHERMQLMQFLHDRRVPNPVVLTGDIHSNWCNDLRVDDRRHDAPLVAAEFVATSLSSGGNGYDRPRNHGAMLAANPCVKFHNRQRGELRCAATQEAWTTDNVVMDQVEAPGGAATTRAKLVLESGSAAAPQLSQAERRCQRVKSLRGSPGRSDRDQTALPKLFLMALARSLVS